MIPCVSVCAKATITMMTRDRVRLDADVYRPDAEGPFPVLLMRQPYGRAIASTVVYAHPSWYAAQGFIVVIQDVRGRGSSEGKFEPFRHEVEDGYDTVEWAAQLPGSNGQVGMYGFSYQGMTQLYAAQSKPPALKAIAPAMVGYHPHTDWAYENGALLLQAGLGWAIQLAAETARLRGDRAAFQALYRASRQLPLQEECPTRPQVLRQYAPDSFFHDWIANPNTGAYWDAITPQLGDADLPMLHIGGWSDPYLRGDLRLYREMTSRSRCPQPLWIGPWGHIPWGQIVGSRDFGPEANSPVDRLQVDWFNQFLKGQDTGILAASPVNLFEMGTNRWRQLAAWPQTTHQEYFLASSGLASMDLMEGCLVNAQLETDRDGSDRTTSSGDCAVDTLVHDPWRPVPSLGGHAAVPSGVFDRAAIDCRSDVLTYTASALAEPLRVAGVIQVAIHCLSDHLSFDLCCTLSEVSSDGKVYPMTQGYGRFDALVGEWTVCRLKLQPTCFCIASGGAWRLSISAASYPAYAINSGLGEPIAKTCMMDAEVVTIAVQVGPCSESRVLLPGLDDASAA